MTHGYEVYADELLRTLQLRSIPLPSEIAAFITLEVCEGLLTRPAAIGTRDLRINEQGGVLFPEVPRAVSEAAAVDALLGLLSELLVCAGPAVPSTLLGLLERGAHDPERTLAGLASELGSSLVPLNRGATRRVIARLVREARKPAAATAPSALQPSATELDAQLDALLSGAPESAAQMPLPTSRRPRERPRYERDLLPENQGSRSNLGLWIFALSTSAAVALLGLYFTFGPREPTTALARISQPTAATPPALTRTKPRYGDLTVQSQPSRAQVFLRIGTGPALATDLPLGVAQEFLALADGYAPARAVLPANASWDEVDGKPRYELAMQAAATREGAPALGPSLLPSDVGTPQGGRLGSVRIVTTPRGAAVYQLIGFTPDVRVENLELDRSYEVLIYTEGRPPVTQHLVPDAFQDQHGKRVAELHVDL